MGRKMHSQLAYVAQSSNATGQSKRNAPEHERHDGRSYSYATLGKKLDVAKQFGRWCEEHYPDIERAYDLQPEHYNAFLRDRADAGCRDASLSTYTACLRSLDRQMSKMWGKPCHDRQIEPVRSHVAPSRTQAMTPEHVQQLRASYPDRWSTGAVAVDLGRIAGLRSCEISRLRGDDIRITAPDRAEVVITRSKGGRDRIVEVEGRDRVTRLSELRYHYHNGRVCPIRAQSIEQNISRHLDRLGLKALYPDTACHAVRKGWAQERFNEYRAAGHSKRDTIRYLNDQLGHGAERDERLLSVYVADIH